MCIIFSIISWCLLTLWIGFSASSSPYERRLPGQRRWCWNEHFLTGCHPRLSALRTRPMTVHPASTTTSCTSSPSNSSGFVTWIRFMNTSASWGLQKSKIEITWSLVVEFAWESVVYLAKRVSKVLSHVNKGSSRGYQRLLWHLNLLDLKEPWQELRLVPMRG